MISLGNNVTGEDPDCIMVGVGLFGGFWWKEFLKGQDYILI
jgi:hypothetical protein